MTKPTLIYLHGFLSSAQGTKANFLRQQLDESAWLRAIEFNPTPRDFEYMTVTGQINRLRQYLLDHQPEPVSLIGSSLGAVVALHYAYRYGGVEKLLLLAPAIFYGPDRYSPDELAEWEQVGVRPLWHDGLQQEVPLQYAYHLDRLHYSQPVPPPVQTVIVHGRNDEVVPLAGSRQYAAAHSDRVRLIEVDSDHRLNDQLDLIWRQVETFLLVM